MTICFPGRPNSFVTVRIRRPVSGHEEAARAAVAELTAFNAEQLQLLAETAKPAPVAVVWSAPAAMIEPVEQEARYPGVLHCPACCHPLGRGTSPAIGYLEQCASCRRELFVRFVNGAVTVTLWTTA